MPIIVASPTPEDYAGHDQPGRLLDGTLYAELNGKSLGVVDDRGVRIHLASIKGWHEPAGSTGQVAQRAAADGGWASQSFRKSRSIEIVLRLRGSNWAHVGASLGEVLAAIPLSLADLNVSDGLRFLQASVRQDGDPLLARRGAGAEVSIPLVAPDPLRYATVEQSASTGLPQTIGGVSLPLTLPLSIGATVSSGRIATTNEGNAATPPTFEVAGPVSAGARITLVSSGASLFIPNEVPAGRTLVLDAATQTALLDGTAPRLVTGVWFRLPGVSAANPAGEDEVAFTAPSFEPAARLTARWRSAYL